MATIDSRHYIQNLIDQEERTDYKNCLLIALDCINERGTLLSHVNQLEDEINQLKQQHAEDLEIKDNLVKMQSETIQYLETEVAKFDGYRQAVKDILGGEGVDMITNENIKQNLIGNIVETRCGYLFLVMPNGVMWDKNGEWTDLFECYNNQLQHIDSTDDINRDYDLVAYYDMRTYKQCYPYEVNRYAPNLRRELNESDKWYQVFMRKSKKGK